jgi:hypothetical protein
MADRTPKHPLDAYWYFANKINKKQTPQEDLLFKADQTNILRIRKRKSDASHNLDISAQYEIGEYPSNITKR